MDLPELRQRQAKTARDSELEHPGAERGASARRGAAACRDEHRQPEHRGGLGTAGGALGGQLRPEGQGELGEHEHGQREHRRECSQLDRGLPGLAADHRSTASTVRLGRGSRRGTCSVTPTVPSAPTRTRTLAGQRAREHVAHGGTRWRTAGDGSRAGTRGPLGRDGTESEQARLRERGHEQQQARQQRHELHPSLSALRRHSRRLGAGYVTSLWRDCDGSVTVWCSCPAR